jgi:hypothetical protein
MLENTGQFGDISTQEAEFSTSKENHNARLSFKHMRLNRHFMRDKEKTNTI